MSHGSDQESEELLSSSGLTSLHGHANPGLHAGVPPVHHQPTQRHTNRETNGAPVNHGKGKINNHNNVHQTHIHLPGGSGAGGGGGGSHPYGGYGGPPPAYGPMPAGYPGYSHQPYYGGQYPAYPMGGYPSHGYGAADPSHGLHPNGSSHTSQRTGVSGAPSVPGNRQASGANGVQPKVESEKSDGMAGGNSSEDEDGGPGGKPDGEGDREAKAALHKDPNHYIWAAGLFFLAGIPLLCWGVGSELIEEGLPLAQDARNGDAITLNGFCTSNIKNSDDEPECFSWEELAERQQNQAVSALLKGYGTARDVHICAGSMCMVAVLAMAVLCFVRRSDKGMQWWMKDLIGWSVLSFVFGSVVLDCTLSWVAASNGFTHEDSYIRPGIDFVSLALVSIGMYISFKEPKEAKLGSSCRII